MTPNKKNTKTNTTNANSNHKSMKKLSCVCGSKECSGVTAVFKVLHNVRGAHVSVPAALSSDWRRALSVAVEEDDDDETAAATKQESLELLYQRQEQEQQQEGIRDNNHAATAAAEQPPQYHVALHHFDPRIIDAYAQPVVPGKLVRWTQVVSKSHTDGDNDTVGCWKDCTIQVGDYSILVPNYSLDNVKLEAQALFKAFRAQQQQQQPATVQDKNESPATTLPASPTRFEMTLAAPRNTSSPSPTERATATSPSPVSSPPKLQGAVSSSPVIMPALDTCRSVDATSSPRIYHDESSWSDRSAANVLDNNNNVDHTTDPDRRHDDDDDEELSSHAPEEQMTNYGSQQHDKARNDAAVKQLSQHGPPNSVPSDDNDDDDDGEDDSSVADNDYMPDDLVKDNSSVAVPLSDANGVDDTYSFDEDASQVSLMESYSTVVVNEDDLMHVARDEKLGATISIPMSVEMASARHAKDTSCNESGATLSTRGHPTLEYTMPLTENRLDDTSAMKSSLIKTSSENEQATSTSGLTSTDSESLQASPPEADTDTLNIAVFAAEDPPEEPVPAILSEDAQWGDTESAVSAKIDANGIVMSVDEFFDSDNSEVDEMFNGPVDVDALTDAFLSNNRKSFRFCKYKVDADLNIVAEDPTEEELSELQALQPLKLLQEGTRGDASETLAVLTAIESKRRYWAMSQLDTLTMEWSLYRIIIQRMLKQTDQIEDLLESSFGALAVYSLMLKDIYNDTFLDDKGQMVSGTENRNKIAKLRRKKEKGTELLESVNECLQEISGRVSDDNEVLDSDVYAMTALRSEVLECAQSLLKDGGDIIAAVEQTESKIQESWDSFEKAEATTFPKMNSALDDRWLAEASYKNTVMKGMLSWKENYTRMINLYDDIIDLDSNRRSRTKEILLSFIPRRRRIFIRASELIGPSEKALANGRKSREELGQDIEKALQEQSRANLSIRPNRSSIMNRSRTFDSCIGPPINLAPLMERNLFDSQHIKETKAVEFQCPGMSVFEVGLAVISADDCLHIIAGETDSDVVLDATSFCGDPNQTENQLKSELNGFLPRISMYLPDCRYSVADDEALIEVTGRNNEEKLSLRLFSHRQTSIWWQAIVEPRMKAHHSDGSLKDGSFRDVRSSLR